MLLPIAQSTSMPKQLPMMKDFKMWVKETWPHFQRLELQLWKVHGTYACVICRLGRSRNNKHARVINFEFEFKTTVAGVSDMVDEDMDYWVDLVSHEDNKEEADGNKV